jgi:DNA invertase Pin-like site-specific DNA recombinase
MKIALYARVSTRDKGQNPEMQLESMRKYCLETQNEIYAEYVDRASSQDLINRVEWTRLMKDASLRKFDLLLIWKLDRAFRSIVHATTTMSLLNSYNVGFRSLNDPAIDTTTPNGQLLFSILAAVSQFEKDLITIRVNEGIKFAQAHGTKSGKAIGRPSNPITLQTICSAVYSSKGNLHQAARLLTESEKRKISDGFLSLRIKRAGIAKNDILQNPAQYFDSSQAYF